MNRDSVITGAPAGAFNPTTQPSQQQPSSSSSSSSSSYPPVSRPLSSTRTSPFGPTSVANTTATANPTATAPAPGPGTSAPMAASILTPALPFPYAQSSYPPYPTGRHSDRDAPTHTGLLADDTKPTVVIRGLRANVDEQYVRIMCTFAENDLVHVELTAPQGEQAATRSAVLQLRSLAAAWDVKNTLNGKNGLTVEILNYSFGQTSDPSSSGPSSTTSPAVGTTQGSRFDTAFAPLDRTSPPSGDKYARNGSLSYPEAAHGYRNAFSPTSSIGKPLGEQPPRVSGKSLINDATDDDDTGDIINNPRAYAENGSFSTQRRATAPHIPLSAQMASLSINTGTNGMPTAQRTQSGMFLPASAHTSHMSPTGINNTMANYQHTYPTLNGRMHTHAPPPANPADQNPPCNTLYVGNLPMDAMEDELRRVFTMQRGYRRMCFRSKTNGPMCFVEFEDITAATKALNELYGAMLSNSKKGGIRLSFSKNPLGVRANPAPGQGPTGSLAGTNGMTSHSASGFGVNGPPPGLGMPPGLSANRSAGSYPVSPQPNGPGAANSGTSYAHSTSNGSNPLAFGNGSAFGRDPWATAGSYFNTGTSTNGATPSPNGAANGSSLYQNGSGPYTNSSSPHPNGSNPRPNGSHTYSRYGRGQF